MRILAVDPGDRRIGIAISDPSCTIAVPHSIINHVSRTKNADIIIQLAKKNGVALIVIGQSLDRNGKPDYQGRRARRLAGAIRKQSNIPVLLWDESDSTKKALSTRIDLRVTRMKRRKNVDHLAAAVILQSYLDANPKQID
jgi:putative Holliday junction resolvase